MSISLQKVQTLNTACAPFLNRLKTIYAAMDSKYHEAADYYGFKCTGCEDNCCLIRFYHHTLLEYSYILKGFTTLDKEKQNRIKQRAAKVCRKTALADEKGEAVRLMCPLNFDGLCLLYAFRPMICRLFGIAHELRQPGMGVVRRPGCGVFSEQHLDKSYFKFDRTPFFIEMAMLEKEFKQAVGVNQKIKMTIAEMIETF
jgi:Fe-S-cluster containining protein